MSSTYTANNSTSQKAAAPINQGLAAPSPHASAAAARQHHLHFHRMQHRFSLTNILGDPFALSTISIGSIGWVVALVGCITVSSSSSKFPVFTWWGLASEFLVIIGVFWICATNNIHPYRLALLACLAVTTVYTTNSTNNFVYNSSPSSAATSAGFILVSIINILWILYYGTTEDAPLHGFVDSYSVNKPDPRRPNDSYFYDPQEMGYNALNRQTPRLSRQPTNPFAHSQTPGQGNTGINAGIGAYGQRAYRDSASNGYSNKLYGSQQPAYGFDASSMTQPPYQQQSFMAAPLGAFENSSQVHHKTATAATAGAAPGGTGTLDSTGYGGAAGLSLSQYRQSHASSDGEVSLPTEYPYRVRANYSYVATDENELSFKKEEVLEVNEIRGKWWQARRENGEIGICPSNYVRLLDYGWGAAAIASGLVGPDGMAHHASAQQQQSQQQAYDGVSTTTTSTTTGYHQNL